MYSGGKTKWVSLKTPNKSVAKSELARLLQSHYAVQDAEASTRKGNATIGELADIYLHGVDLQTDLKQTTKDYRRKTVRPELKERIPGKITEAECKLWADRYNKISAKRFTIIRSILCDISSRSP